MTRQRVVAGAVNGITAVACFELYRQVVQLSFIPALLVGWATWIVGFFGYYAVKGIIHGVRAGLAERRAITWLPGPIHLSYVWICGECLALVAGPSRDGHALWHRVRR